MVDFWRKGLCSLTKALEICSFIDYYLFPILSFRFVGDPHIQEKKVDFRDRNSRQLDFYSGVWYNVDVRKKKEPVT